MSVFPETISFTLTNDCNLRCKMCGQWSERGYIRGATVNQNKLLKLSDWKRLIDEIADFNIPSVILRGGETFLYPDIIELVKYINGKGIFISIDTNGMLLKNNAADIAEIGNIHITISIDGPEEIHDKVRDMKNCYKKIKEGIDRLIFEENKTGKRISRSICFTISPYSISGLGQMPDVARDLSIDTLVIVPYNYIPDFMGKSYEKELKNNFGMDAFSWTGFCHDDSGIDFKEFRDEYRKFKENLNQINLYPYMVLSEDEYGVWFGNPSVQVGPTQCSNIEKLIDIQPDGSANFCVDNPDYCIGNVRNSTIAELWKSNKANQFREYRRKKLLPVCYRCVSKHMSENH